MSRESELVRRIVAVVQRAGAAPLFSRPPLCAALRGPPAATGTSCFSLGTGGAFASQLGERLKYPTGRLVNEALGLVASSRFHRYSFPPRPGSSATLFPRDDRTNQDSRASPVRAKATAWAKSSSSRERSRPFPRHSASGDARGSASGCGLLPGRCPACAPSAGS